MTPDLVFGTGNLVFAIFTLVTAMGKRFPNPSTSAAFAIVLGVFALQFAAISCVFAALMATIQSGLWCYIFYRSLTQRP